MGGQKVTVGFKIYELLLAKFEAIDQGSGSNRQVDIEHSSFTDTLTEGDQYLIQQNKSDHPVDYCFILVQGGISNLERVLDDNAGYPGVGPAVESLEPLELHMGTLELTNGGIEVFKEMPDQGLQEIQGKKYIL